MDKDSHIYFGTASNPNPYEQDATPEQIAERQRKIDELVDHLLSGKCKPSDLLQEDCYDLVDMIIYQAFRANEKDDDRILSVRKLIGDACTRSATWLIDSGNTTVTLAIKKKLGIYD